MTFIASTGTPIPPGRQFYLNVSHTVGAGGKNYWTDIMAVQFLIRKVYLDDVDGSFISPISVEERRDVPDPFTDYMRLKKTEKWIRRFQKDLSLVVDGRVDRAEGHMYLGKNERYTIWQLNVIFSNVSGYTGSIENILNWSTIPQLLKAELAKAGLGVFKT